MNKNKNLVKKDINSATKKIKKIDDICTIIENCNISKITKYLVEEGKKKKFPDIAKREINEKK